MYVVQYIIVFVYIFHIRCVYCTSTYTIQCISVGQSYPWGKHIDTVNHLKPGVSILGMSFWEKMFTKISQNGNILADLQVHDPLRSGIL